MNKFRNYAIVDVETTGGSATYGAITDIAIFITDGEKVIDQFESLINPEQFIPYQIQALTGITNEMVSHAPTIQTLAPKIYSYLSQSIFVAHNVSFDYGFVKNGLAKADIEWNAPKLCTVKLGRKIIPGYPSYSLGKICADLDIPIHDRHRASGDAEATVALFHLLRQKDEKHIVEQFLSRENLSL